MHFLKLINTAEYNLQVEFWKCSDKDGREEKKTPGLQLDMAECSAQHGDNGLVRTTKGLWDLLKTGCTAVHPVNIHNEVRQKICMAVPFGLNPICGSEVKD